MKFILNIKNYCKKKLNFFNTKLKKKIKKCWNLKIKNHYRINKINKKNKYNTNKLKKMHKEYKICMNIKFNFLKLNYKIKI